MIRTLLLLFTAMAILGVVAPQLAGLLLVALLLLGAAGLVWSSASPFQRRRRGGRR